MSDASANPDLFFNLQATWEVSTYLSIPIFIWHIISVISYSLLLDRKQKKKSQPDMDLGIKYAGNVSSVDKDEPYFSKEKLGVLKSAAKQEDKIEASVLSLSHSKQYSSIELNEQNNNPPKKTELQLAGEEKADTVLRDFPNASVSIEYRDDVSEVWSNIAISYQLSSSVIAISSR